MGLVFGTGGVVLFFAATTLNDIVVILHWRQRCAKAIVVDTVLRPTKPLLRRRSRWLEPVEAVVELAAA
jgi:hypothetical protein